MERLIQLLPSHFVAVNKYRGHIRPKGKGDFTEKNPYILCYENDCPEDQFFVMFCEKDTLAIISVQDIDHVLKVEGKYFTWYKLPNGFIATHMDGRKILLQDYILEKRGPLETGYTSVHLNKNKSDNRSQNLERVKLSRFGFQGAKHKRRHLDQPLPDEIGDLPESVVYYREKTAPAKEYFRIERHPIFEDGCVWTGTQTNAMSVGEKLSEALDQLAKFDDLEEKRRAGEPAEKIRKRDHLDGVNAIIDFYKTNGKFPSGKSKDPDQKKLWNLLSEIRRFEKKGSTTVYVAHRKSLEDAGIPWKTK